MYWRRVSGSAGAGVMDGGVPGRPGLARERPREQGHLAWGSRCSVPRGGSCRG